MGSQGRQLAWGRHGRAVAIPALALCVLLTPATATAQNWVRPGDILFGESVNSGDELPGRARVDLDRPVDRVAASPGAASSGSRRGSPLTTTEPVALAVPPVEPDPALEPAPLWNASAALPAIGSAPPYFAAPASDADFHLDARTGGGEWHLLPGTLLYHAYLAGEKEPRIGLSVLSDSTRGWLWEAALGGRVGILRRGPLGERPADAWQIDLEGAALARVSPSEDSAPLEAVDYRIGIQWTRRRGPTAWKAGYYHISSHAGDEYLLLYPDFERINYVRDSLVCGVTRDVITPDVQVYGEIGYALGADGGAEPLELQFGAQYNPLTGTGLRGAPFAAVNVHLREEVDFGGGINVMAGWRWRSATGGRLLRIGLQYYNGKSIQYQFLHEDQQLIGYGVWYDY